MADLGTENYDQEFTLGLIENEQGTLELVNEALDRMENGTFGQCVECGEPISKPRLQAIPYARHCIRLCTEAGGWRMKASGVSVDPAGCCSSGRSPLGGTGVRSGDQVDRLRPDRTASALDRYPLVPRILELQTSQNTGALWGFGRACPAAA